MDPLGAHDVAHLRAPNPGPFTLSGTNTWIIGRDPCWVVDPGPDIDAHLDAVAAEAQARGGAAGLLLTHDHGDHADGIAGVRERLGGDVRVGAVRHPADIRLAEGDKLGPLEVVATPGHAPDHVAFVSGSGVLFSGDAILGEGSVFVAPDPGALRGYLDALRRLRARPLALIACGHGPLVTDAHAKIDAYIAHRLDRERRLVAALERGLRGVDEILDEVWSDAPPALRLAATVTLAAHLDKLEEEGSLPEGAERPDVTFLRGRAV